MKAYIMAWRNLWRNRKRTLITVLAVLFAVFLSTFMSSMQEGTYARMIENTVSFYSGYIQVHDTNFWETKSINDIYSPDEDFVNKINSTKNVTKSFPRIESFTLLSTGENTKGAALLGIDPVMEDDITGISQWIEKGQYLKKGDDGILLAINLAKQLDVEIGDTLTVLSIGYHGATAAALFPLKGILNFPSPTMNGFGAYVDIKKAQEFYSAGNMITSTVIMVDDYNQLNHTKKVLESKLDDKYKVMTWAEMQPEIVQMIEQDRMGAYIMKGILYMVIGFGILGTIIMMISERKKEMAIMVAVGMQKRKLNTILFFETLYIGFIGVIIGFIMSAPIMAWLAQHPIPLPAEMVEVYEKFGFEAKMFFSLYPPVFINQAITIFIITMVVFLYPCFSVFKFKLIKTLRG